MPGPQIVECVPNISEGRDAVLLDALASIAPPIDRTSDPDHNRSVFTYAGRAEAVFAQSMALAEAVFGSLNLSKHRGVHPRIGVLDVLPFVPVAGLSLADCAALAHRAAEEIWRRWQVPSFFYEHAGSAPLEEVRRRARSGAIPDTGKGRHHTAGAVAIGARDFLIAWNIWLDSNELQIAKKIALSIRASSGGFTGVKALGLPLTSRDLVQVSINSTDFETTPLHLVFNSVERLAAQYGIPVLGSELIGLIPQRALDLSRGYNLRWLNWHDGMIFEQRYSKGSVSHLSA